MQLAPAEGFPFSENNVDPSPTQFELIIDAIGTTSVINPAVEVNIQAMSVLFMSAPVNEVTPPNTFLSLSSDIKAMTLTDLITFISSLNSTQTELFNNYNTHKIYFVLLTLDSSGNVVHYSVIWKG